MRPAVRTPTPRRSTAALTAVLLGSAVLVASCTPSDERTPTVAGPTPAPPATPTVDAPDPSPPAPAAPRGSTAGPEVVGPDLPAPTAEPQDVLTGLTTPWDLAFLPGGAVLVTLRDPAQVLLLTDGGVEPLTGAGADELARGADAGGEGGLLGIALAPDTDDVLYLYRTTPGGNEVVRAAWDAAGATLGALEPVLTGIPSAATHNGGRIAFGPDGMLHVATGDAGLPGASQDPASLAGKILRVTADGAPAPDNPTPGSPVLSLGHRNVQGLGWDAAGTLVASEFGQNRTDELNVVEPGGNYGWPEVEGTGGATAYVDPVVTWTTDEASPSGIAVTDDAVYVAALRGRALWEVPWAGSAPAGEPVAHLVGDLGRLRHVAVGPDGALWVLTQNTDGRGDPREGDDRLVRLLPP